MAARARRPRRLSRRTALLLVTLAVLAGLALLWAGSAWADPSPAPGPSPTAPGAPTTSPGTGPSPSATPSPSAPVTPSPIPAPPSQGTSSPSTGSDDPAWYDINGQIRKAVADLIVWVANQALQPVLEALGRSWLSTPELTGNAQVSAFWTTSLVTANGVFVLFIVAGGFLVTSRETLQTRHGLKQVLPRIALGAVLANCSLILCGKAIEWTNALTVAIAGNTVDGPTAATAIRQMVDNAMKGDGFMMALLVIAVIVMCLVLEFTFVLRLAALILLIGIAPAALICHASPLTEGIAHTWWRAFAACLGLQLAQAIVVMATVKIFLTPTGPSALGMPTTGDGLLGVLVCITMLWILIKLPGWMRQFVLGPLGKSGGRGLLGQLVHAYLTIKTLGAASGLLRGASAAGAAGTAAGRTATSRPGGARPSPARTGGARPPRPPRPSPARPSPAGPAAFSHAPVTQAPLSSPSGTNGPPSFSDAPSPAAPSPAPSGGVPAAQFSHPSPTETPRRVPAAPAARVAFSDAAPEPANATARPAPTGAAPAATFSAASAPHSAPRRPPAPVTPVFSSAPPAGATGAGPRRAATPASRPTAARRATTAGRTSGPAPTPTGTPPARTAAARRAPVTPPARTTPSTSPSPGARRSVNPPRPPSPSPPPSPSAPRSAAPSPAAASAPVVPSARPVPSPPARRSAPVRRRPRERGDQ